MLVTTHSARFDQKPRNPAATNTAVMSQPSARKHLVGPPLLEWRRLPESNCSATAAGFRSRPGQLPENSVGLAKPLGAWGLAEFPYSKATADDGQEFIEQIF